MTASHRPLYVIVVVAANPARRMVPRFTSPSNRHDFGVSWQDHLPGGGVVVSNKVAVAIDVEAILLDDLERTGVIANYR